MAAEDLVAIGTLALAGATVWLGWQVRETRIAEMGERRRAAIRAAIIEQTDNARAWLSAPPESQPARAGEYAQNPRPMEAFGALLSAVDLPADLTAYLVWLRSRVAQLNQQIARALRRPDERNPRSEWQVQIEQHQLIVCLLRAHAGATPDLRPAAEAAARAPWLSPDVWPDGGRVGHYSELEAMGGPPFPSGAAFASCQPGARDREAAALHPTMTLPT